MLIPNPADPAARGLVGDARAEVIAAIARDGASSLNLPHVVYVDDPFLDVPLVFGPFAIPIAAVLFADSYQADVTYEGCEALLRIKIAPIHHVR